MGKNEKKMRFFLKTQGRYLAQILLISLSNWHKHKSEMADMIARCEVLVQKRRDENMVKQEGARRIVQDCIGIKPDDQVLLITDTGRPPVVEQALYEACIEAGVIPKRLSFDGVLKDGQPPETISTAMKQANVVICITTSTLGYSTAAKICTQQGGRVIVMTEATEELLTNKALEADFVNLQGHRKS